MKNLIKLVIVLAIFTIPIESFTQTLGLRTGLNLAELLFTNDEEASAIFNYNAGFQFGSTVEFPITGVLNFETGLILTKKGFRYNEKEIDYVDIRTFNLYYLEMPSTVKASYEIGSIKLYGIFGPYIGFGLFGSYNSKYGDYETAQFNKYNLRWLKDNPLNVKHLDVGLIIGTGVNINRFEIGLSYSYGLLNILPDYDSDSRVTNSVFSLYLCYIIRR
jgi:hypothetical protein